MSAGDIIGLLFIVAFFVVYVASAAWAVGDAQKRGYTGGIVVFLLWVLGPFAAIAWRLTRPKTRIIEKHPSDYSNADDAIDGAVHLDMLGELDAAIALYRDAAARWPEHAA